MEYWRLNPSWLHAKKAHYPLYSLFDSYYTFLMKWWDDPIHGPEKNPTLITGIYLALEEKFKYFSDTYFIGKNIRQSIKN